MDCSSFSSSSVRVRLRWAVELPWAIILLGRDMAVVGWSARRWRAAVGKMSTRQPSTRGNNSWPAAPRLPRQASRDAFATRRASPSLRPRLAPYSREPLSPSPHQRCRLDLRGAALPHTVLQCHAPLAPATPHARLAQEPALSGAANPRAATNTRRTCSRACIPIDLHSLPAASLLAPASSHHHVCSHCYSKLAQSFQPALRFLQTLHNSSRAIALFCQHSTAAQDCHCHWLCARNVSRGLAVSTLSKLTRQPAARLLPSVSPKMATTSP